MLNTLISVALGGAIGASARYLVNIGAGRLLGLNFPWGTLAVNIVGSFLMGVIATYFGLRGGHRLAPFMMTGILGGFTTFSAFSLDAVTLFERGEFMQSGAYVVASVVLSIGALVAGLILTRMVLA